MDFNDYQIPKEYTNKFKVTSKDKKDFKKFWNDELTALKKMKDISENDIKLVHKSLMNSFWIIKAINKEKYTPRKYKNNIYINTKRR